MSSRLMYTSAQAFALFLSQLPFQKLERNQDSVHHLSLFALNCLTEQKWHKKNKTSRYRKHAAKSTADQI